MSYSKIFGAAIYYHVSKESRKKLEPMTVLGIFLGHTETPHNYHVYLSSLKMKVVQRNIVKFDKEKAMSCSIEMEL